MNTKKAYLNTINRVIVEKANGTTILSNSLSSPCTYTDVKKAFLSLRLSRVFTINVDTLGTALVTIL
jgi:hypothetical protein